MTKKERILEILSRKEAATPVGDALLNAAKKTEAFARSRPGVGTVAGSMGGGLLGALLSKGSRKKRLRDILLGMGIGGAGGYAAGRYMPPLIGAGKEEYDPVVDGARFSQEPVEDNSSRKEKAAPQKAPALTERQKAGQRMSEALAKQGRRQAIIGGLTEFGTQLNDPRAYDEFLGNVGGAVSAGARRAAGVAKNTAGELVTSVQDIGRGAVDLGSLAADAMKEKRDVYTGKKLPADIQAEYDRLLKGRSAEYRERNRLLREKAAQQAAQDDLRQLGYGPEAQGAKTTTMSDSQRKQIALDAGILAMSSQPFYGPWLDDLPSMNK